VGPEKAVPRRGLFLLQGLRMLTERYGKDGFQVIAFSCNQFGGQAPGTSEEERAFAIKKFGIESLPVMVRPACALATLVAGYPPGSAVLLPALYSD
jgi:hypothetical protein